MKERNQTKEWRIPEQPYIRVWAYRSSMAERVIIKMHVHVPGYYSVMSDLLERDWKAKRRFWGKLIGFEKQDADITNFFYQLKKQAA